MIEIDEVDFGLYECLLVSLVMMDEKGVRHVLARAACPLLYCFFLWFLVKIWGLVMKLLVVVRFELKSRGLPKIKSINIPG